MGIDRCVIESKELSMMHNSIYFDDYFDYYNVSSGRLI